MRHHTAPLLAFLCFSAFSAQDLPKINIAVNDLVGKGVDASTASIVSDRLRAELINTGVFRVMERGEMEIILKEQGFQKSGACDEASCLVEVGQLLGVQQMVAGSIGKVDDFFTISLRMISVATGEILYTISVDSKGTIEDVILRLIGDAALKLGENAGGEIAKAITAGKKGDLYITTDQPGASVEIDGKKIEGQTPLTLQGFRAGEHRIIVRKDNRFGSKTIMLNPDDLLKVQIAMNNGEGAIKVFTNMPGATVFVDGVNKGQTPMKIDQVANGEHIVRIEQHGYLSKEATVAVNTDETANFSPTMEPAAHLTIAAVPSSATIIINGHMAGTGQIASYEVAAGDVSIQVEAPSYNIYRTTVNLSMGQILKKEFRLEHTKKFLDSMAVVNAVKKKKIQWARRIAFGTLAAGFGGVGAYFNYQSDNYYQTYKKNTAYNVPTHDSNWNNVKVAEQRRNIAYIITAVCGVGFAISIPF